MKDGINLETVICKTCSLVYSNPIPPEELYYKYYTEAYNTHYKTEPQLKITDKCPVWIQRRLDNIQTYFPNQYCKILEVGSGNGENLFWIQQQYRNAIGIEPGPNILYSIEKYRLNAIHGFFDKHPFPENSIDMIVMIHVFEHFYDPNIILSKCNKILNEDGYLYLEIPNIHKPFHSLDNYFLRYVHLINYSENSITAMLAKHNFKVVKKQTSRNNWLDPWNLTIIAKKEIHYKTIPLNDNYKETIAILNNYRIRWYLYSKYLNFIVINFNTFKRKIKHFLSSTKKGKLIKYILK